MKAHIVELIPRVDSKVGKTIQEYLEVDATSCVKLVITDIEDKGIVCPEMGISWGPSTDAIFDASNVEVLLEPTK